MKTETPTTHPERASDVSRFGARQPAHYRNTGVPRYDGNPLIEALPPVHSEIQAAKLLTHFPAYQASDRQLPDHIRIHQIQSLLELFIPLPIHTDLDQRLAVTIRNGYVNRNPADPAFWGKLDDRVRGMQNGHVYAAHAAAPGFNIYGISGAGKTTGISQSLGLYQQVIEHDEYQGRRLKTTQIVYLKMACPFDGSVKGLCQHFFEKFDGLLGTSETKRYVNSRSSVDQLLPSMARLASIHNLGLLVVDEIQHLSQNKSGGRERMLNFFVDLVNRIQLPVVLVGTFAAADVLGDEFRQVRRGCGQGDLIWDPMGNDAKWRCFVKGLWRYQYLQKDTPLTKEILDALYDECQGITDFAVKIFMFAQARAIKSGIETITPAIIRSVASDSLRSAQHVIRALRLKDYEALSHMKDVAPTKSLAFVQLSGTVQHEATRSASQAEAVAGTVVTTTTIATDTKPKVAAKHVQAIVKAADEGLLATTSTAAGAAVAPYSALKMTNFLRPASEFSS